jgi:uncharacterized protein
MNLRGWAREHSLKLLAIRDTPEAIAGGVAIGMFLGFTPLFGLKTVLAISFAWLLRCNILAAVIAGTLHDLLLPFMPVIYVWEYKVGFWLLNHPHQWPEKISGFHLHWHEWHNWRTFLTLGRPLLVGSIVYAIPAAIITFFATRTVMIRHQKGMTENSNRQA